MAAQDRFFEMDFRRHVTAGRLSELVGTAGLETDRVVRTMGWRNVAEKELALARRRTRHVPQRLRRRRQRLHRPGGGPGDMALEYVVLGLQFARVLGREVDRRRLAGLAQGDGAGTCISNYGDELTRARLGTTLAPDRVDELFPDYSTTGTRRSSGPTSGPRDRCRRPVPSTERSPRAAPRPPLRRSPALLSAVTSAVFERAQAALDAVPDLLGRGDGIGSNSWVVAGEHDDDGQAAARQRPAPRHRPSPGIWYQIGLHCRSVSAACPFDVSGYTFAGMPGVVIGHNAVDRLGPDQPGSGRLRLLPREVTDHTYLRDGAACRSDEPRRPSRWPAGTTCCCRSAGPSTARSSPTSSTPWARSAATRSSGWCPNRTVSRSRSPGRR